MSDSSPDPHTSSSGRRGSRHGADKRSPLSTIFASAAVGLAIFGAVRWLGSDDGSEAGGSSGLQPGDSSSAAGTTLPEAVSSPVQELQPNTSLAATGEQETEQEAPPLPEYEAVTVRGQLIVEGGGGIPPDLSLCATFRTPTPRFQAISINQQSADYGEAFGDEGTSFDRQLRLATRTVPDANGFFEMPAVPASGAWLQVEDDFLFSREKVALELGPGAASEAELLVVKLERGAQVMGHVSFDEGTPLEDARVRARSKMDAFMMFDGTPEIITVYGEKSAADGAYQLVQVPAGTILTARFSKANFEVTHAEIPVLSPGATYTLDVDMAVGATIGGTVTDAQGAPLEDVRVLLQPAKIEMANMEAMDRIGDERTRTDAEGAFKFRSLTAGSYRLLLASEGYLVTRSDVIELNASEKLKGLSLVAESGLSIAGQVLDHDGDPISTAEVRAATPPSMMNMAANMDRQLREQKDVDAEGRFRLGGYEEGKLRIWVDAEGYISGKVDVQAGDTEVLVTLQTTCSMTGIAITLEDSEPLTDYMLTISPEGGLFDLANMMDMQDTLQNLPPPRRVRDEDGQFRIEGMAPGSYDLTLTSKGYAQTVVQGIEVLPEKGASGVILFVPEEAKLVGQVVSGRTGEPLEGAVISTSAGDVMSTITDRLTGNSLQAVTDDEGRFQLGGLGTDPVPLTVQHQEYEPLGLGEQRLQEGEVLDLGVLRLSSGATVYGHVRQPNGAPSAGVTVFASTTTGSIFRRTDTDEKGAWRIQGLSPGSYNVTRMDFAMDIGGDDPAGFMNEMVFKMVTLEADEEKRVDLVAESGGVTLEGTVRSTLGPEAHAMVWAVREDGPGSLRIATSDDKGQYAIDNLQPGGYLLQVMPSTDVVAGAGSQPMAPVSRVIQVGLGPTQREDVSIPGGKLVGRTVSKRSGEALSGVRVIIERTDANRTRSPLLDAVGGRVGETYSDDSGTFRFGHLADGTYAIVAGGTNLLGSGDPGWATTRVDDLTVAENREGFTLEVELEAGGSIAGVIKDSRGKPLGNIPLWARNDRTGEWTSVISETLSAGSGNYEVNSLEPGPWTLAVGGTSHALTLTRTVDVRREHTVDLDVVLQEGVEIWLDSDPDPVAAASVLITSSWGTVPVELSSVEGLMGGERDKYRKRLGRLLPGSYDLTVFLPDQEPKKHTLTLTGKSGKHTVKLSDLE